MNKSNRPDTLQPTTFITRKRHGDGQGFVVKQRAPGKINSVDDLAVPPDGLLKYGQKLKMYLESGQKDAQTLRDAAVRAGLDANKPGNVLEFGCANARVLRWLFDWSQLAEVWGVDIDSDMIFWCHEHLSPPFQFAVSTTEPHLFFEDRFFSLVYCYSVFTHVDDLYLSWIAELRRIIKPGGVLFVTIRDQATAELQQKIHEKHGKLDSLEQRFASDAYDRFLENSGDFVTISKSACFFSCFKRDYAIKLFASYGFELVEILEATMGNVQTALVLRRKQEKVKRGFLSFLGLGRSE